LEARAAAYGFEITEDPPDVEYIDGTLEAGVAYPVGVSVDKYGDPVTQNHWAAIDGGDCDRNCTYTDYQGNIDENVTAVVRDTPAPLRKYMVRPGYDDMKRREFENDDEDDSDRGGYVA
jgi:hypothetical protein